MAQEVLEFLPAKGCKNESFGHDPWRFTPHHQRLLVSSRRLHIMFPDTEEALAWSFISDGDWLEEGKSCGIPRKNTHDGPVYIVLTVHSLSQYELELDRGNGHH